MRRKTFTQLLLATSVAAFVPLGPAQAEPLQSAELTSVIGNKGFEFRGRYTMWKFGPDGRVTADDSRIPALTLGGSSEQFGMKNSGTWRVEGNQLCIKWQNADGDQCFTVNRGRGRMVTLAGPRTIEGTIDARDDTGFAETPRPAAPGLSEQPGLQYHYQRIPGAR